MNKYTLESGMIGLINRALRIGMYCRVYLDKRASRAEVRALNNPGSYVDFIDENTIEVAFFHPLTCNTVTRKQVLEAIERKMETL